ncbi:MAG: hypothetical protein UZ21_OP11001000234 [Microgenomates bacterium OLB22]|nr:MAG: hypothetical protein UZ21_OP11001000234 [Microgenomates bacterium OLB22]
MKVTVVVHPNARQPRIEQDLFGTLHIYVSAPPLEGKANKAVIEACAQHFKVKKSQIQLVAGEKSKHKTLLISK